jgi:negative regulator of flagellin synthesis FlgM
MQIYGPSQIHGAQPINAPHAARGNPATSVPASSSTGDRLDISEAGQIAGRLAEVPEIRADRVQELRTAILEGSYETDAKLDVALERLLDEIG